MEEKQVKSTEKIPSNNAVTINSWITSFLSNQVVDKILAFIAMLPFLFYVYRILIWGTVDIVRICIIIQHLLLVITMLFRRSPMRVTTQPLYWLLTFVATYWLWLTVTFTTSGTAIIPHWLSVALALVGLSITVYARVSLGRNIGLVPAQRLLVTTGAYRLVRHPIYTGCS
jgi:protein-S-isoprenylcysteine O-methyltransferase Ste14